MKRRSYLAYRGRGQQLVEVACGLLFLIPIFLFLFDVCFMYLATNLSDGVARDAARAAAGAEPNVTTKGIAPLVTSQNNFQRADAVVKLALSRSNANGYIRRFDIVPAADKSFLNITTVPDPFRGGQWQGTVTVRTQLTYTLPVSIPKITPDFLTCEAVAQFPITASRTGTVRNFVK